MHSKARRFIKGIKMAAYVFAVGGSENAFAQIREMVECGIYSTRINSLSPVPFEGTVADYQSMKAGDDVYFFSKRKFYGIGKLVNVGPDCKYNNYPDATLLMELNYSGFAGRELKYYGKSQTPKMRWLCFFKPSPAFFVDGLDMDDVLRYKPYCFKMIRAFEKRSFIKLDDEESRALREIFLIRKSEDKNVLPFNSREQEQIAKRRLEDYCIKADDLMIHGAYDRQKRCFKHEMAIEACLVGQLVSGESFLGKWDFVSHQVVASPAKPVSYMDRMDVLAMRYVPNETVVNKYLVAEIKKDMADESTISQVMEYVDWLCDNYAYGDYGMIEACVIAPDFRKITDDSLPRLCTRTYMTGSHPATTKHWSAIKLVKCSVSAGKMVLEPN